MRYKIVMSYDGSNFSGFQKQPSLVTVEGEIEKALATILQEEIDIVASGRTDAGVHALGQVAHFDTDKEINDLSKFVYSLNSLLPKSIDILSCERVSNDFHARYSTKLKTYLYKIYLSLMRKCLKVSVN